MQVMQTIGVLVLNANEVKVNFRVSPQSAVAELIKGEEGKYLIAADYHQLTRATGTHFAIKKIEAVTGEPNVSQLLWMPVLLIKAMR